jgi:hypothetical protein
MCPKVRFELGEESLLGREPIVIDVDGVMSEGARRNAGRIGEQGRSTFWKFENDESPMRRV